MAGFSLGAVKVKKGKKAAKEDSLADKRMDKKMGIAEGSPADTGDAPPKGAMPKGFAAMMAKMKKGGKK